jgi:hypothetical protein
MKRRDQNIAHVVRLDAYREAVDAARFLLGCLHEPKWLRKVTVELGAGQEPQVLVLLNWETPLIRRCLPTAVNGVAVTVRREVGEPAPAPAR